MLLAPLVDAGVNEINPSRNQDYIAHAIKFFGTVLVRRRLDEVFETGTPFKQAGALNAMYWAQPEFVRSITSDPEVIQREMDAYNAARGRRHRTRSGTPAVATPGRRTIYYHLLENTNSREPANEEIRRAERAAKTVATA